eukprot:4079870-Amphidinium_carterae.1
MMEKKDLSQRFIFDSPMACALHRTAHHHFQLSATCIKEKGFLVVGLLLCADYVAAEGSSCQNGYSASININLSD